MNLSTVIASTGSVALAKAVKIPTVLPPDNKKERTTPGSVSRMSMENPLRGFIETSFSHYQTSEGVLHPTNRVPDNVLREIERKNIIVAGCVNLRQRQLREFSKPSVDDDTPGFRIALQGMDKKPSAADKKAMTEIAEWFTNTGRTDFQGWEDREDTLYDVLCKWARDIMLIDKPCAEIRRDRVGRVVDFHILDGATIKRVLQSGFLGNKSFIDPRNVYIANSEFYQKLASAKLAVVPPLDRIRYVQELDGRIVAAFTRDDLLFDPSNKVSDIRSGGYGISCTEQAINAVSAFLWAFAYNSEAFNSGTLPKIALAFEDQKFSPGAMSAFQDEWIANFRGVYGAWRIPMLNGKVNVLDLYKSPRDMEYNQYLQFTASLICQNLGVDVTELGLRFQHAQNVLSENMDARQKFSKDRGLHDMLGHIESMLNKIMRLAGWHTKYRFEFTGISVQDRDAKAKLTETQTRSYKLINEARREQDLPDDPYGDIVANPVYIQYRLQKEQQESMAQSQGGEEEQMDMGELTEDAFDDVFKAMKPLSREVRTLLK